MSKSNQPTSPDSGKTKQQLLDELNLLRHQLSELERAASGVEKNATNDDSQNALTEIKRSEALLNEILNISADAIISIDENQCITRFNQGAQQTFGYRAQELVGEALEILLPEQFRRSHGKHVQDFGGGQVASRMMNQRRDIVGLRKDGTTFPARASISRIERDGKTTLSVILRDVSDIRVAEQAARQSQSELAHVTRIGLLGEISASLAHELNQPLGAILSNAQVLKRQIDATPTRLDGADEVISDVIYDVRRAGAVVQRLRALSKPGKQKTEAVDLNQIVTETKDLLSSEIVIRQVSLTMELAPGLPAASCDRIQLQQILLNFLTNAFDAMDGLEPAGRHLLIRTRQAGTTAVEVCVKDSGVGFKGESDQRLFEPFYTTKESGMGMGLAISRTILQAHGGRLWAENNRGPGAAFYFTVPADSATDATASRRHEHEHEHKEDQSDVATVFIVDDDSSFRKAMGRLIGSAGYAIETFASAQAFLQREQFDEAGCLVVDLHMPGETGLELQTTLNTRNYTMPIIFITGAGNTSSGVRAMKQGAVDFLSKPVDDEVLLRAVAHAVETDKQARSRYAQYVAAKEKITRLTAREVEIMALVVKGMRNKQIADTLGISEKTVKAHRGHVMEKIEAGSVANLVRISEIAADVP
jgi:two-component system sensor kinase FixL